MNKYLKYAIGEVLLVVIGILIALQINNWNENRKRKQLETAYLTGILKDLKTDASLINDFVRPNFLKHDKSHMFLDSLVINNILITEEDLPSVWSPQQLTKSGHGFYPTVGNYKAMISEGQSGLIKDRELFGAIQELYEVWHPRNVDYLHRRDRVIDEVRTKHTYKFQYGSKLENLRNQELLADLRFMYEYKRTYIAFLEEGLESHLLKVIEQIEKHLKND